ncbi:hypothetical protein T10_9752 [Trichinella papuae]|uniref:Uncharacterized protein n=1 Tax=Trichinella papuae TaxID=268474 RepID=A0A0V1M255_9BILA|nr:hypothetical protein T10_9752 [Trichinella papuae]
MQQGILQPGPTIGPWQHTEQLEAQCLCRGRLPASLLLQLQTWFHEFFKSRPCDFYHRLIDKLVEG